MKKNAGNLLSISYGAACGWGGPNYDRLMSNDTPLESGPLTKSETSSVVAVLSIGGMIGTILYGYLINIHERRMLLVSMAVSQIVSRQFLIYFTTPGHFVSNFIDSFNS